MSITVEQAMQNVMDHAKVLEGEEISLDAGALGRILTQGLLAPQPSPRWDVSAMDGFALHSLDFPKAYSRSLELRGTCHAGERPGRLAPGGAIRIMTGAMIPQGADAVVPKELVRLEGQRLWIEPKAEVFKGDHIRFSGEELKPGVLVASPGTRLNSRWIGFLNGLGLTHAKVHRKPRVKVLITGSELKKSGAKLEPGQIHDSNGPMLEACLSELGIHTKALRLADHPRRLERALALAFNVADVVIVSGGISVGDADYTKGVMKRLGVKTVFWGVEQKPGKPFFFGTHGKSLVFGLPGNPAAVWVCFHEYLRPALGAMQGAGEAGTSTWATSPRAFKRDLKKTLFLKASLKGSAVELMGGQQSHMLHSLARANALAVVRPRGRGRRVEVREL